MLALNFTKMVPSFANIKKFSISLEIPHSSDHFYKMPQSQKLSREMVNARKIEKRSWGKNAKYVRTLIMHLANAIFLELPTHGFYRLCS